MQVMFASALRRLRIRPAATCVGAVRGQNGERFVGRGRGGCEWGAWWFTNLTAADD